MGLNPLDYYGRGHCTGTHRAEIESMAYFMQQIMQRVTLEGNSDGIMGVGGDLKFGLQHFTFSVETNVVYV